MSLPKPESPHSLRSNYNQEMRDLPSEGYIGSLHHGPVSHHSLSTSLYKDILNMYNIIFYILTLGKDLLNMRRISVQHFLIRIGKQRQRVILGVFLVECFLLRVGFSSRTVISGFRILWLKMVLWLLLLIGSLVDDILNIGTLQRLCLFVCGRVIGRIMWCGFFSPIMLSIVCIVLLWRSC
jgi:hypothetical protein